MHREASLVECAQEAFEAWLCAMGAWSAELPPSSLPSRALDRSTCESEQVDVLYRRWCELAREVAEQRARNIDGPRA